MLGIFHGYTLKKCLLYGLLIQCQQHSPWCSRVWWPFGMQGWQRCSRKTPSVKMWHLPRDRESIFFFQNKVPTCWNLVCFPTIPICASTWRCCEATRDCFQFYKSTWFLRSLSRQTLLSDPASFSLIFFRVAAIFYIFFI